MRVMALLLFSGLATACGGAGAGNGMSPPGPPDAALPAGAIILDGAHAPGLLSQCSRRAPAPGEAVWQPAAADIVAVEAALPAALATRRFTEVDWSAWPQGWRRQYVGKVRGGRRFIYGSFVPRQSGSENASPAPGPEIVCDGGPAFFGAEYEVAARRVSHLAFNGALRPPPR